MPAAERRWLSDYHRAGVTVTTVAWALERTVEEIAVRFKILGGRQPEEKRPAPFARAVPPVPRRGPERPPAEPETPRRRRDISPSPIEVAGGVFGPRLELRDGEPFLDGRCVTVRELVVAAAAKGVAIPYPGIAPLAASFHSGPSVGLSAPSRRHASAAA